MEEPANLADLISIPKLEYNCTYFKDKNGIRQRPVALYLISSATQLETMNKIYRINESCTQVNVEFMRRRLLRPMCRDRYVIICTKKDVALNKRGQEALTEQMVCLGKQFVSPKRGLSFTRFRRKLPIELTPPMTMLPLFNTWLSAHAKPIT